MKPILLPGMVAGFLLGLFFAAMNILGEPLSYSAQEIIGIAAILVALFIAQRVAIAKQPPEMVERFLPAYFTAVLSGVAAALVYGVMTWLYFSVIDKTYLERFYARYMERAQAAAENAEEREQLIAAAGRMKEFVMDPVSQAMVQFGTVLMLGLLTGVIVALLHARKRHRQ